jgi:septal ring factor EnvC (AmiA/AmiB activator)
LRHKNEVHEIEERKNAHINDLIVKHDSSFAEMKAYYNEVTQSGLENIKNLKDRLEDMKKKEASDNKLMLEVTIENKRLSEPLQKAVKEVESLRHQLANYNKDKESLQHTKARVKVLEGELKAVKWEHEVLEQRFAKVYSSFLFIF